MGEPTEQWVGKYEAAVLETDNAKLSAKIDAAEAAIQRRYQSNNLVDNELKALEDAMKALTALRKERLMP